MYSTLSGTEINASGQDQAYEEDASGGGYSYGQGNTSLSVTFVVKEAVTYQLTAAITPGSGLGQSGSFSLTAANGANPVNPISVAYMPTKVNQNGTLTPGTYTIRLSTATSDNNANGPESQYQVDLTFPQLGSTFP